MEKLQSYLPKSGAQNIDLETWPGNFLKEHCQIEQVSEIKAIKGVEKYIIGNSARTHRQTICLCRKTQQIFDLGVEEWTTLTKTQQRRKAMPSHIMIGLFGNNTRALEEDQPKSESIGQPSQAKPLPSPLREEDKSSSSIRADMKPEASEPTVSNPTEMQPPLSAIPSWSQTTVKSWPKFLENSKQSMIRKMHNN